MNLKKENTTIYTQWRFMRRSCYDPKHPDHKEHQKAGVYVCQKWAKFKPFLEWWKKEASNNPLDDTQLRVLRKEEISEYSPANCYLAEKEVRTKRAQKLVFNGRSLTVKQWSEETGIKQGTIYSRWKQGLPAKVIFRTKAADSLEYEGEIKKVAEWASEVGISASTIRARIGNGWSIEKALNTAPRARRPPYFLEFEGRKRTMSEWAAVTGIPQSTIANRLGSGWSVREALTTKRQEKK